MMSQRIAGLLVACCLCVTGGQLPAQQDQESAYYIKRLRDLHWTTDQQPTVEDRESRYIEARLRELLTPRLILPDGAAGYVSHERYPTYEQLLNATVGIKAPAGEQIKGTLCFPKEDYSGMRRLEFTLNASDATPNGENEFLQAKRAHYQVLLARDIPGAAWFRHQVRSLSQQLGEEPPEDASRRRRGAGIARGSDLGDTMALLGGGRALAENLQLDRMLPDSDPAANTVPIVSIEGVEVEAIDWAPLLPEQSPELDPLANIVPEDQHALFLPSFEDFLELIDHAQGLGTPLLHLSESSAEDAQSLERYQRQLGLTLNQAVRFLGPRVIGSVALTGGDPYFRTGTDVAVLLQTNDPQTLRQLIITQVVSHARSHQGVVRTTGETEGVPFERFQTPDRTLCSYVAALDDVVIVTNSAAQLARLAAVASSKERSLGQTDEYRFFRHRYVRGEQETAFLMITDATIRRWCSPRWRIANSRRTRAAAQMAELRAAGLDKIASGQQQKQVDATYGTLEFLTPISELDLPMVTQEEAQLYRQWKQGYERAWSNFFDPIGIQVHLTKDKLVSDLTVIPLIGRSDYRMWINLTEDATLKPEMGDPHDALVHLVLALDRNSTLISLASGAARSMAPQLRVDPLGWLGDSIAVYIDNDPLWQEAAEAEDVEQFLEDNVHRIPLALHIGVSSGLKLTAFLAALRAYIEQTAPGMTTWENVPYKDRAYVKVAPSEQARSQTNFDELTIYYAATGEALVLSLNEAVLKRAIDRQLDDAKDAPERPHEWLGKNIALQATSEGIPLAGRVLSGEYQDLMQQRAWAALPILNEWQQQFGDHDPIAFHEQYWQRRLLCPGGGEYVWNPQWQTMESTVYGHPGRPKRGTHLPQPLQQLRFGNFGLTFEHQGLRAQAELHLAP